MNSYVLSISSSFAESSQLQQSSPKCYPHRKEKIHYNFPIKIAYHSYSIFSQIYKFLYYDNKYISVPFSLFALQYIKSIEVYFHIISYKIFIIAYIL